MTIDDTRDNTKLANLFGAEPSVSLVEVAGVFGLHESWLAQKVASEVLLVLRHIHLSFSHLIAHSVVRACESWLAQEVVSELCCVLRLPHLRFSPSIAHSFVRAWESLELLLYCVVYLQDVS